MAGTITSANSIIMLSITGLFPAPQQLQGFAADDIFDNEQVEAAEIMMGVDGKLSAGFVFVPIKQSYSLQADSASVDIMENWYRAQQTAHELFFANGTVTLPSVGKTYTMNRGVLSGYSPMSDAKKVLQPRKFGITWESVLPAAI